MKAHEGVVGDDIGKRAPARAAGAVHGEEAAGRHAARHEGDAPIGAPVGAAHRARGPGDVHAAARERGRAPVQRGHQLGEKRPAHLHVRVQIGPRRAHRLRVPGVQRAGLAALGALDHVEAPAPRRETRGETLGPGCRIVPAPVGHDDDLDGQIAGKVAFEQGGEAISYGRRLVAGRHDHRQAADHNGLVSRLPAQHVEVVAFGWHEPFAWVVRMWRSPPGNSIEATVAER